LKFFFFFFFFFFKRTFTLSYRNTPNAPSTVIALVNSNETLSTVQTSIVRISPFEMMSFSAEKDVLGFELEVLSVPPEGLISRVFPSAYLFADSCWNGGLFPDSKTIRFMTAAALTQSVV
jgi:hypothetical protein